jgi:undecaprenyl-diphosphatase
MFEVTWINRMLSKPVRSVLAFARSEAVMLAALAIIAATLLGFFDLAEDMVEGSQDAFDMRVITALHSGADPSNPIGPAWLDRAMLDLTSLGSLAILVTVSLVVAGYLIFQGQKWKALALAIALGGGLVLSETLKSVFERTRPPDIYRTAEALNASFPSGHALLSTVVYLTLGAMLARAVKQRRLKTYVLGVAIMVALIVGVSRVYLGLHWPSDVMAGWCLGAAWAMACWLVERSFRSRMGSTQVMPAPEDDTPAPPIGKPAADHAENVTLH